MENNQEPIRIAQIIGKWVGGGVEAVVMNYYRHIDKSKIQFDFICDEDSTNIPYDEINSLGGKVILIPPYQKVIRYHKELKKVLKENNYQIVHSHINTLSVFSLWAAKSAGVPVRIAHSHSTTNKKEKKKNLMKQVLKHFSKVFATDYMCCSELAGRWLFGDKEYEKGNVYLLNNAIDLDKFKYDENIRKEKRKELNISDDTLVIGHVGRFVEQKNHRFLIDIFNEVHKEREDSILLLAGQGPLIDEIKEKTSELGLNESIKFLGQRNDIDVLYQAFDVFLLPSLYEGLPVVGVEAQATGLFCIMSDDMTKETKVLDSTKFLKINDGSKKWADEIINSFNQYKRMDSKKEMLENGYEINNEANKLEMYYEKFFLEEKIMKKIITITNAYTWYNKGDAGILLGTINTLKQIYGEGNLDIRVLSFTPEEDAKRYCKDKTITAVYSNVLNPHPYKHSKIGKVFAIIKLIFKFIYLYVLSNLNIKYLVKKYNSYKTLEESDFIVVCGGGFLGGKKLDSFMHVFQMYVNTKFNKNVYVMGTSIEPIKNKLVKKFTDDVLKKMTYIFAREVITYNYLETFIHKEKFTLIPDMAFMLEDKKNEFEDITKLKENSNLVYGITVRQWNFPNSNKPIEMMDNYINSIIEFMNIEIEKNNSFVFVPQVIVEHGDDTLVAERIKQRLTKSEKFLIIRNDISPVEIKSLIGNFDYFIGTRMHSNIFATSMKIPTIAIAYEKKTNGIMHTVGLDDYIIEIDQITKDCLIEKAKNQIKNNASIRENLNKEIKNIRSEILEKMKEILLVEDK